MKRYFILFDRILFSVIGLGLLAGAVFYLVSNPSCVVQCYVVSNALGLYLGHTKVILIVAPLFLYFTWKYHPLLAPVLMVIFYAIHEFIFNSFFFFYFYPATASSAYWGNYVFLFEIILSITLFSLSVVTGWFNPFRSKWSNLFLLALAAFMLVWMFGFNFVVTNSYVDPTANLVNRYATVPNVLETSYNLLFAGVFLTAMKFKKSSRPFGNPDRSASTVRNA